VPIALEEELIGLAKIDEKNEMLEMVRPQYIVLKPSLHGGIAGCREWIELADKLGVKSWMTSALESNVGLNAIAQFAAHVYGEHITFHQGLGTGQLFNDNTDSSLSLQGEYIWHK
jgi:O-succinylbenzoate synthase